MKTVYKYTIPHYLVASGLFIMNLPKDAEIIRVGKDIHGLYALRAIVDVEKPIIETSFEILMTGATIPNGVHYVGTIDDNGLMWHMFQH